MKYVFTSLLLILGLTLTQAQTLDPIWLKQIASSQNGGGGLPDEWVDFIDSDEYGNIYVAGVIQQGALIDTTPIQFNPITSANYIAKFSCSGKLDWYKIFGRNQNQTVDDVISFEVYGDSLLGITISYLSQQGAPYYIDFDTTILEPQGGAGQILLIYDYDGNLKWHWGEGLTKTTGSFPNLRFFNYLNRGGFCKSLSGKYYGLSTASDSGMIYGVDVSDTGTYLTKLNKNGAIESVFMLYDRVLTSNRILSLPDQSLILHFTFSVSPPIILGTDTLNTGTNILVNCDTNGNVLWAKSTGLSVADIEVSNDGNLLVLSGGFANRDFFGFQTSVTGGFIGEIDAGTGMATWLTECKTLGVSVSPSALYQQRNGDILWGGVLVGAVKFGNDTISSQSNRDIWISKLDSSGNYQWVDFIVGRPSGAIERLNALASDQAENIYFGGLFEGRLEYPSDTVFKRGGVSDGFFAKLGTPGCFVCPTTVAQFSSTDSFLRVSFNASASLEADSFFWDFDDGSTDTGVSPVHTFSMDGIYNVCLIAKSDCDADTICQMITVADSMVGINDLNSLEVSVYPNPSRDGVFTVRTEAGLDGEIVVYDLLGKLVIKQAISQDGKTFLEIPTVLGTYFMELRAKTKSETEKIQIQ
jgi:hypothetical protein